MRLAFMLLSIMTLIVFIGACIALSKKTSAHDMMIAETMFG